MGLPHFVENERWLTQYFVFIKLALRRTENPRSRGAHGVSSSGKVHVVLVQMISA